MLIVVDLSSSLSLFVLNEDLLWEIKVRRMTDLFEGLFNIFLRKIISSFVVKRL